MIEDSFEVQRSISIDNFQIFFYEGGEGKITIIFIHGFPFNREMWRPQMEFFNSSNRVFAYDIRGFGESSDNESILSIDLFADDLIRFMDSFSIEKATICGLSMGGYIALNAVERFPNRFEALVLSDTQCSADNEDQKVKRYELISNIEVNGTDQFIETFITNVFSKDAQENKGELVEEIKTISRHNSARIICQGLNALATRNETCSTLTNIKIPTLIIFFSFIFL